MISVEMFTLLKAHIDDVLKDRAAIFLRARNGSPAIFGNATPAVLDAFVERVITRIEAHLSRYPAVAAADTDGDDIIAHEVVKSVSRWDQADRLGAEAWQLGINFFLMTRDAR